MIKFSWINLFAIFALRIYVIINAYFFFSLFLISYFAFFSCNFECMMTSIFFIIFAFSSLMFCDMLLTFISCIIILNLSRRKVAVVIISLTQKSFNFNIFLLFSEIILNIINFLNLCIFVMFLRVVSVIATLNSYINVIISFAFIFCTYFIFWVFFSCH